MLNDTDLLNAVVAETGLPEAQAEEVVHTVVDSVMRQFEAGEPVLNMETGTADLVIEKDTVVRALIDKANLTAAEAQPVFETILELLVRV